MMMQRLQELSTPLKVLAVTAVAIVMLAVAAGVGAMAALVLGPGPGPSAGGSGGAGGAGRQQEANSPEGKNQPEQAGRDGGAPDRLSEAEYVGTVGDIQGNAVEAFLDSHDKLLRYDAITAGDVEEMRANEAALEGMADRASELAPPLRYEKQHKVFSSALDELHEATRLAYGMAADPVAAAELGFDDYDEHVKKASALLQRSNELLGKDYKTIAGVREISPGF
jgi:hypothetical protein